MGRIGDMSRRIRFPVSVQTIKGARIADATLVLPGSYADLNPAAPYQVPGPTFVRANVDPLRLAPKWIIDAEGLTLAPDLHGRIACWVLLLKSREYCSPSPSPSLRLLSSLCVLDLFKGRSSARRRRRLPPPKNSMGRPLQFLTAGKRCASGRPWPS